MLFLGRALTGYDGYPSALRARNLRHLPPAAARTNNRSQRLKLLAFCWDAAAGFYGERRWKEFEYIDVCQGCITTPELRHSVGEGSECLG